ncbi:hypothetical protein TNCT_113051 [Trichonephila clavata]|uniref:Uncharacterized protein n=1 Tax=Trichonephila clavata TaxID=2740835 RepID=A0A8X6GVB1_TRICU|nr:hypothetical protein TNCT_113051 [Trichonephila clavata]
MQHQTIADPPICPTARRKIMDLKRIGLRRTSLPKMMKLLSHQIYNFLPKVISLQLMSFSKHSLILQADELFLPNNPTFISILSNYTSPSFCTYASALSLTALTLG